MKVKYKAELTKVQEKHSDAKSRYDLLKVTYDAELKSGQENHDAAEKSLEVGIQKERDEAQAKNNKHAVDIKKLQGVHA